MKFQALVPSSIELHLLCHVNLLYRQVDPNLKPKAKKSLLPLPILPLMWQPLAHLNQCYSSNSLPFMQVSSHVGTTWELSLLSEFSYTMNSCSTTHKFDVVKHFLNIYSKVFLCNNFLLSPFFFSSLWWSQEGNKEVTEESEARGNLW